MPPSQASPTSLRETELSAKAVHLGGTLIAERNWSLSSSSTSWPVADTELPCHDAAEVMLTKQFLTSYMQAEGRAWNTRAREAEALQAC